MLTAALVAIVMMLCLIFVQCNVYAGSEQRHILALCYVTGDERMIVWDRISNGGMKRKEEGERECMKRLAIGREEIQGRGGVREEEKERGGHGEPAAAM